MEGLIVLTLVVVPGTGDWTAVTEPPCGLRPDSGSVAAWLAGEAGGGPPICAKHSVAKTRIRRRNAVVRIINIESYQLSCLRNRHALSETMTIAITAKAANS